MHFSSFNIFIWKWFACPRLCFDWFLTGCSSCRFPIGSYDHKEGLLMALGAWVDFDLPGPGLPVLGTRNWSSYLWGALMGWMCKTWQYGGWASKPGTVISPPRNTVNPQQSWISALSSAVWPWVSSSHWWCSLPEGGANTCSRYRILLAPPVVWVLDMKRFSA